MLIKLFLYSSETVCAFKLYILSHLQETWVIRVQPLILFNQGESKMGNSPSSSQSKESWNKSSYQYKDPEGTHTSTCIANSSAWMKSTYEANCSGCTHERANSVWSNQSSGENLGESILSVLGK